MFWIEKSYVQIHTQFSVAKNVEAPHKRLSIKGNILYNILVQKNVLSLES